MRDIKAFLKQYHGEIDTDEGDVSVIDGVSITVKEAEGGEGQGDTFYVVLEVRDGDSDAEFWMVPGWYQSHYGGELEWYAVHQVKPVERTHIDWDRV